MLLGLSGCATTRMVTGPDKPVEVKSILQKEFDTLPPPTGKPITVAVYTFADKTTNTVRTTATTSSVSWASDHVTRTTTYKFTDTTTN